jgi:hypothetical protein
MASTAEPTLETKPQRRTFYTKVAISLCAFALLVLHRLAPNLLPTDTLGLGLLAIVVLPWIVGAMPLSEIDLLGVKLKVSELDQKQKQQEKVIDDLVTYSMSASIFRHLCGIGLLKEYRYVDNESNRREFYFLRDNGFIKPKAGGFLEFNKETPWNVCEIATPTPIGWLCVKLRKNEVPREWLTPENKVNLAVDPDTL